MKATIFNPEEDPEIIYLKNKFEFFREKVYGQKFLDDLSVQLKIAANKKEQFEISILAAAERYEFLSKCNLGIEPVYKAKGKIEGLQKKLVIARQEYEKFLDGTDATVDELFMNLDNLYEEGKHERFFEFLHDARYRSGGVLYNLKSIFCFFDALIEATQSTEEHLNKNPIKKNDPLYTWLNSMEDFFEEYTEIAFTQGKYYTEIGYVSDCLEILYKVAKPLDEKITHQKIANKIKQYNAEKTKK